MQISTDKIVNFIIKSGKIHNYMVSNQSNNIDSLRKFHNFIKTNLIVDNCVKLEAENLIDIACGRGGDLHKWLNYKLNLKFVLAFDNHKESIYNSRHKGDIYDGAISRFNYIKRTFSKEKIKSKTKTYINFQCINLLDSNTLQKLNQIDLYKKYDVVSCQFAMHYFCESDEILNNTLHIISSKLNDNGLFIGTATDGDIIRNILQSGDVNIPLLFLVKDNKNSYLFNIQTENSANQGKNYFEIQGVSSEFYLLKDKLTKLALNNNLELIQYKSFYDWYQDYKHHKHFVKMSTYEMIVSFLNFSFIFRKIPTVDTQIN